MCLISLCGGCCGSALKTCDKEGSKVREPETFRKHTACFFESRFEVSFEDDGNARVRFGSLFRGGVGRGVGWG